LASEGRGPESALSWRERVRSWERELRLEGSVPVRDDEARLMLVTRLDESHWIPFHWQNGVVLDQPGGGGFSDCRKLDMTASSAAATKVVVMRKREREER